MLSNQMPVVRPVCLKMNTVQTICFGLAANPGNLILKKKKFCIDVPCGGVGDAASFSSELQ